MGNNRIRGGIALCAGLAFVATQAWAGATLVEPGHTLRKIADSCAPSHPSQVLLDVGCAFGNLGNIESVASLMHGGGLWVQVSSGAPTSVSSCILSVNKNSGVVSVINPGTGFGINERGTDLAWDPVSGLLVTQDQNFPPGIGRLASVHPVTGVTATWAPPPVPMWLGGTLGMEFARKGLGDIAPNELVFTSDVLFNGIYSTLGGGPVTSHLVPPMAGDDVVVQPDGDWVHVGDVGGSIIAFDENPPHAVKAVSPFLTSALFTNAGLAFVFGTRASGCPYTGEFYVSYSGPPGGTAIFRVDEPLATGTLVATIGPGGLQDLTVGQSAGSLGNSLYFTVHTPPCEEIWELTLPECETPLAIELESFTAQAVGDGVRVEWVTASERDHVGFRLLSEREGVRQKHPVVVTPQIVLAQGSDLQGAAYEYLDRTQRSPGTVLYWLEDIDIHGNVTRHGPVTVNISARGREAAPTYREGKR